MRERRRRQAEASPAILLSQRLSETHTPCRSSGHARRPAGGDLETHPGDQEDDPFARPAPFEIEHHPRILGQSKRQVEKSGTASHHATNQSLDGQSGKRD